MIKLASRSGVVTLTVGRPVFPFNYAVHTMSRVKLLTKSRDVVVRQYGRVETVFTFPRR